MFAFGKDFKMQQFFVSSAPELDYRMQKRLAGQALLGTLTETLKFKPVTV